MESYPFFVAIGLIVGIFVYYLEAKKRNALTDSGFFIAFGSVAGGIIGSKILEWLINIKFLLENTSNFQFFLSGRTIVGGLIGGTLGALLTKKLLGIKEKRGNMFAPAIAIGVSIGRFGCFLRGCCYGKQTVLIWGVDFGDGIHRHPTQLYESLFMLVMFFSLQRLNKKNPKPGQLFKLLMIFYFTFRFFVEFVRVETPAFWGLTIFQVISLCVILYLTKNDISHLFLKMKLYGRK